MTKPRLMLRKSKYKAVPTVVDGVRFDSKGEAARYHTLVLMERAGQIANLARQVRIALITNRPDGVTALIGHYVADFAYTEAGQPVLEDFKGHDTPLSAWKRKHVEAQTGIPVRLTGARRR